MEFAVGQGLGGGDGDAVPGVDPHGIKVLDGADDDAVVGVIPHDLHLVLFPAQEGFLDQDFRGGGSIEAGGGELFKLFAVVGHSPSGAAEGESGADNERESADLGGSGPGLLHRVGGGGAGAFEADLGHAVLEELAILPLANGLDLGTDEFDLVALEGPGFVQGHGGVQGGLASQGGEEGVRLFLGENKFDDLGGDGFDVGSVSKLRVGHDGGRVAVDQDDAVTLFAEGLAGLDPGIVEFAGLTDDNGAGADDEDGFDVGPAGHEHKL